MRQEDAEELQKKIMSAKFDFNDFLKQTRAVARMGSMTRVLGMIPGMGKVWKFVFSVSRIIFLIGSLAFMSVVAYLEGVFLKPLLWWLFSMFTYEPENLIVVEIQQVPFFGCI